MKLNHLKVSALWSMLAVAGNAFGQADQLLPPIGGGGGAQYSARCASHEILNGFELRTGDDVDAIRPICAPIDTAKVIGARRLHPESFGGTGGVVTQLVCPDNTPAIAAILVGHEGADTDIVNNVHLYCSEATPNQRPPPYPSARFDGDELTSINGGLLRGRDRVNAAKEMQRCPKGLMPVGINGRSGIWLDSLGFICGVVYPVAVKPTDAVKSIGRVGNPSAPRPAGHICDAARDARARNSPAAPNLEAQCRAAPPPAPAPPPVPVSEPAAITAADLQRVMARGLALAKSDPLAAELRRRVPDTSGRRGFDIGMGIWAGNTAPGAGKQRYRDALPANEQKGFDIAAAFSLPRNRHAVLSGVGAAIANADRAVAAARAAENDVFFRLGFDIASGIFGNPAAGAQGNTATGPGSQGIRNELNPAGQRGFDAATALHLARHYK